MLAIVSQLLLATDHDWKTKPVVQVVFIALVVPIHSSYHHMILVLAIKATVF